MKTAGGPISKTTQEQWNRRERLYELVDEMSEKWTELEILFDRISAQWAIEGETTQLEQELVNLIDTFAVAIAEWSGDCCLSAQAAAYDPKLALEAAKCGKQ